MFFKSLLILLVGLIVNTPLSVHAHQPRIAESNQTVVSDPEISKAYYGKLTGEPHVYTITTNKQFNLYVNVLVPAIEGQAKDVSAVIIKDGNSEKPVAVLDGTNFSWKQFYEPFGADTYWMGPEYRAVAQAGTYEIRVSSANNDSKYSLAIGEIEAFNRAEGIHALTTIPKLKSDFFNTSPISFISSPFGWGLIVAMYSLAVVFGLLYRFVLRRFAKGTVRGANKNIGRSDRMLRFVIGIGLLVWAITTTWNPVIIFFSGFAFFEALFGWCGFYAALGKNTCPIK